jgi:hypothetical protein
LFEEDTHEHLHLTALTGLPTFHMSALPDLLLRERIENVAPDSLRRFNVRWVIGVGRSPGLGDPASEIVLGTYHIRTLPDWDGKFARVERGYGTVETVQLDDRAVEVDVRGNAPVLIALGTGYYPRWRATHASGVDEPVYALAATGDGTLHVVSAWVAPGRTVFTCDGPLPSDGDGRVVSALAALFAAAAIVAWRRPRWRVTVLRQLARARAWSHGRIATAIELGVPVTLAVLAARGWLADSGRTPALLVGSGLRAVATVEARLGGGRWQDCPYSAMAGRFRCDGVVAVSDATANVLNDAPPSWPFITPAISAIAEAPAVEVRISMYAQLSGRYWATTTFGTAELQVGSDPSHTIGARTLLDFEDRGEQTVTLTGRVPQGPPWFATVVAEDALEPDRTFLAEPPRTPPSAVSAIAR